MTNSPKDNPLPILTGAEQLALEHALLAFQVTQQEFVDFLQERQSPVRIKPGTKERVLLSEVFGSFRQSLSRKPITRHRRLKEVSRHAYEKIVDKVEAHCREMSDGFLDELSLAEACEDFVSQLVDPKQTQLKPSTMNKYIAVVRRFLQFVQFYYSSEPLPQPSFQPLSRPLPLAIGPQALRELQARAASSTRALRLTFLLEFLLATGLRRNEFRLLQKKDLDLNTCTVIVRHTKNDKERIIPFSTKFRDGFQFYLHAYKISDSQHFLYGQMDNPSQPVTNSALDQSFRAMAEKVSSYIPEDPILGYRLHSLRHTYATYLLRRRVPLRSISQLLGHSSMRTTAIYTVLDTEQLREEAAPGFRYLEDVLGI